MEGYTVKENKLLEARSGHLAKVHLQAKVAKLVVTEQSQPDVYCRVKIHMWPEQDNIVKVAFSFMDRYVVKVNGEIVELEDKQIAENTVQSSNQFQFCHTKVDKYCVLRPVGDTGKFLSIMDGKLRLSSPGQQVEDNHWQLAISMD